MRRLLLRPRWLALHVLAIVLAATCLGLGWWQLGRARSGNALSYGYALQWPAFAVFVVIMWWRMVRDALSPPVREEPQQVQAPAEERARAPARAPNDMEDEVDDELAAYNRYLARLNAEAERRARP